MNWIGLTSLRVGGTVRVRDRDVNISPSGEATYGGGRWCWNYRNPQYTYRRNGRKNEKQRIEHSRMICDEPCLTKKDPKTAVPQLESVLEKEVGNMARPASTENGLRL